MGWGRKTGRAGEGEGEGKNVEGAGESHQRRPSGKLSTQTASRQVNGWDLVGSRPSRVGH